MKKTIAILALAALGFTSARAGVQIGINFGIPVPAPAVVVPAPVIVPPMPAPVLEAAPACPVPGYVWVVGSWGLCDNHWVWAHGHWAPPAHWGHAYYWDRGYHAERHAGFHGTSHGEHGRR